MRATGLLFAVWVGVLAALLAVVIYPTPPDSVLDSGGAVRQFMQAIGWGGPMTIVILSVLLIPPLLMLRSMLRDERSRRGAAQAAGQTLGTLGGGALGILAGLALFQGIGFAVRPDRGPQLIRDALVRVAEDPLAPEVFLLLLSTFIGGLVGALVTSRGAVRRGLRAVPTVVTGAFAGALLYATAALLMAPPETLQDSRLAFAHFTTALTSLNPGEFVAAGLGAIVGTIVARNNWRMSGTMAFTGLVAIVVGYILYTLSWTLPTVPPESRGLSILLFLAEAGTLTMVLLYSFYSLDVASRRRWRRTTHDGPYSKYYLPKVVFQVPTYNEPPTLVFGTLQHLLAMDYPEDRFIIQVADDSTDPACAEPLRRFCEANGIAYLRREGRAGYKAGALNNALTVTPKDVDLIAVVDADYHVEAHFLRETVGAFIDPGLAWLQTPQDYRNRDQSFLTQQYYLADAYFYRAVLPSRNEENSIIFCGTMGILRREALENVGGWDEHSITEDAELSVRLVDHGYGSMYVNRTYGRGLIPPTFEGFKAQHHRWAFGGGRILRKHLRTILFGRFTRRQKFDYMMGSIHWIEGLFILGIALGILILAGGELLGQPFVIHHNREIVLIGLVPLFLLGDGLARLHMVMRRTMDFRFGATLKVLGMWFSVKFSNAFAATKALIGVKIPFARTAKGKEGRLTRPAALRQALRVARFESFLSSVFFLMAMGMTLKLVLLSGASQTQDLARAFMLAWLLYYGFIFAASPIYAYKSYVTLRPEGPTGSVLQTREGVAA